MPSFSIRLTRSAEDDLDRIPGKIRRAILSDVQRLSGAPFPPGAHLKKLVGFKPPLYRMRTGDFRVLYRVEAEAVFLLRVIDRKELERAIKKLPRVRTPSS
jgi:mRNA interferase RelE/StbE